MAELTPYQTIGPFFHDALVRDGGLRVIAPGLEGERIVIEGRVRDGAGDPVADALIEIWQADPSGSYPDADPCDEDASAVRFDGFGRVATEADGGFVIETVRPGAHGDESGRMHAPHLLLQVFARGILSRLVTRIYFEGDARNEHDPVLALVPTERRSTLIARSLTSGQHRFDVVLQGLDETVFFDV